MNLHHESLLCTTKDDLIQGGACLYYRVLFVLQGAILYYKGLLSTTRVLLRTIKYDVVPRGTTLYYKVIFGTPRYYCVV